MKKNGWISLDRSIEDHWIYKEEHFCEFHAWIDLLMLAKYADSETTINGRPFIIHRGSLLTSIRKLATRWGWSKDKVLRFLRILRDEEMVKTATVGGTLITIVNYGKYQIRRDTKRDRKRDSKPDTDKDTGPDINNKVLTRLTIKEKKKEQEDSFFDDEEGEDPAELRRRLKEANQA